MSLTAPDPSEIPAVLSSIEPNFSAHLAGCDLRGINLVVGIVDPVTVAAATVCGVRNVLVTDHLWDWTYGETIRKFLPDGKRDGLAFLRSLYARADRIDMWPAPVTPDEMFVAAQANCTNVRRLAGVVERPFVGVNDRESVRKQYGMIDNGLPTVLVATGALGSLQAVLDLLYASYLSSSPVNYNVILDPKSSRVFTPTGPDIVKPAPPLIDLAPSLSLVWTRCGGGAVNSLIAAQTPFNAVLEPFHVQVNAIARAAAAMRLIPEPTEYEKFASGPRELIQGSLSSEQPRAEIQANMRQIGVEAEEQWAREAIAPVVSEKRGRK